MLEDGSNSAATPVKLSKDENSYPRGGRKTAVAAAAEEWASNLTEFYLSCIRVTSSPAAAYAKIEFKQLSDWWVLKESIIIVHFSETHT